jgi:hypothetical protein
MPSLAEIRTLSGVAVATGKGVEVGSGMDVSVAGGGSGVVETILVTSGVTAGADWHAARHRKKRGNIFFIIG